MEHLLLTDIEGELLRISHQKWGTAYQRVAIDRAVSEQVDGTVILVLTPKDVIVHKLIAGRFQDLADIESILATSIDLDLDYLVKWADVWEVQGLWERLHQGREDRKN